MERKYCETAVERAVLLRGSHEFQSVYRFSKRCQFEYITRPVLFVEARSLVSLFDRGISKHRVPPDLHIADSFGRTFIDAHVYGRLHSLRACSPFNLSATNFYLCRGRTFLIPRRMMLQRIKCGFFLWTIPRT